MTTLDLDPAFFHECFEVTNSSPSGLKWKVRPRHHFKSERLMKASNTKFAGKNAGAVQHHSSTSGIEDSVWRVRVSGVLFLVARIVFVMCGNKIPNGYIVDHINRDRLDNSISNLRLASHSENAFNKCSRSNTESVLKGVSSRMLASGLKWRATVSVKGSRIITPYFDTAEEASKAYDQLAHKLHGEFFCNAQSKIL